MMDCFAFRPSSSASSSVLSSHPRPPPPPDVNSAASSTSRTHPSPAVDIRGAYERAIQSNPYSEWWIRTRPSNSVAFHELPSPARLQDEEVRLPTLADVLYPNQDLVNEELQRAKDCSLNRLISNFFQRSEDTTRLLLDLNNSAALARRLYRPAHAVLSDLSPFDSLSEPQINRAYDEFALFHSHSNPFPPPDPNNLDEIRQCFSDLKIYLNRRIRKSSSKIRLICLAPTHLALCTGTKQDLAQQNEAAKKLFVLEHELNSLVNLVKRLGNSVEDVRRSMRFGLDRGRDKHSIEEVLKQLTREQTTFLKQLDSLEKHIAYCHGIVSSARCLILEEENLFIKYNNFFSRRVLLLQLLGIMCVCIITALYAPVLQERRQTKNGAMAVTAVKCALQRCMQTTTDGGQCPIILRIKKTIQCVGARLDAREANLQRRRTLEVDKGWFDGDG